MRAVLRLGIAMAAAALALGQAPALAQSAPEATTNTPAPETIGPRELQNFNLQGTVTRPAEPAPTQAAPPAQRTEQPARAAAEAAATPPRPERAAEGGAAATGRSEPVQAAQGPGPALQVPPDDARPSDSSPIDSAAAPVAAAAPAFSDESEATAATLLPEQGLPVWPWMLAAIALGGGAAFLLWRRNHRQAFAGGPQVDAFAAPEPEPRPRTPPPAPEPPKSLGIVSTRLRPWVDITFEPLRCVVEQDRVAFDFELQLFNSGSASARDLLIEASMFNASPTQDEEIRAFFDEPVAEGERIAALPPLKRVTLRPKVVVPLKDVRVLEAGGRKVFVPLLAFNALYKWGGSEGQTSAVYLLGRDTNGEKMAPFRLDLGPRLFRGVGARLLPVGVRN